MNTAAPSRKKLLSLVLTLVFMLTCLPAALAVDLNVDAGFYFKQSRGGTCTLASAAMMLRRRAYFDGLSDWTNVTENSVRSTAWALSLIHISMSMPTASSAPRQPVSSIWVPPAAMWATTPTSS